ncbi:MAG: sulfurtransferase TusA family protein [Gammaproteobacteria bacterium]|nr:sulfurtransferase TusA family protein [Gammaproteobacteria bacterium]
MSEHNLDARRLLCPMPVIRTQNKVKQLAPGDILEVFCTDPGVKADIPAWCRINGHHVLGIREENGDIIVRIQVNDH